jgi:hypothetical protein
MMPEKRVHEKDAQENWVCTEESSGCDEAPTPYTCCLLCPHMEDCIRDHIACETLLYSSDVVHYPKDCEFAELRK